MLEIEANFFSQWSQQQKNCSLFGWSSVMAIFFCPTCVAPSTFMLRQVAWIAWESAGGYNNDIVAMSGKKGKKNVGFVKRYKKIVIFVH